MRRCQEIQHRGLTNSHYHPGCTGEIRNIQLTAVEEWAHSIDLDIAIQPASFQNLDDTNIKQPADKLHPSKEEPAKNK